MLQDQRRRRPETQKTAASERAVSTTTPVGIASKNAVLRHSLQLKKLDSELNCSFCRGKLEGKAQICPCCGTLLHAACQAELGRCPTLGCVGSRGGSNESIEVPLQQISPAQGTSQAWEPPLAIVCGLIMTAFGVVLARQLLFHRTSLVECSFWGVFSLGMIFIGGITALKELFQLAESWVRNARSPRPPRP